MCRFSALCGSYPFVDLVKPERLHARLDAHRSAPAAVSFLNISPQMVTALRRGGKYLSLTFNSIYGLISFCLVPFRAIS